MRASLVLLCFNQEHYVREAIASALAQTVPLEILISDDCSTDATWSTIQEAVRDYSGPHKVSLHRNVTNLGVGAHTFEAISRACGGIVILAAGDDTSLPHRATLVLDAFVNEQVSAVTSHVITGGKLQSPITPPHSNASLAAKAGLSVLGAALAFRKAAIVRFGPVSSHVRYGEDILLPFRASLCGDIVLLPNALVEYRQHPASIMGTTHPSTNVDVFVDRLKQITLSLAAVRADQMRSLVFALDASQITLPEFASISATITSHMRREEPLRKLLHQEPRALLTWLRAVLLLHISPADAAKTLLMGISPSLWRHYTAARLQWRKSAD